MNHQPPDTQDFRARARARGEAKNAEARAALTPLAPGERPRAVTVAAIAALLLAVSNLIAFLAAGDDGGPADGQPVGQLVLYSGVLAVAAAGMWRSRYWAVLGFQTVLALQIIVLFLALTRVDDAVTALLFVAIIVASGTLFWFLIRAMARIQTPEDPALRAARERQAAADGEADRPIGENHADE